jgi:hypothetical protein
MPPAPSRWLARDESESDDESDVESENDRVY